MPSGAKIEVLEGLWCVHEWLVVDAISDETKRGIDIKFEISKCLREEGRFTREKIKTNLLYDIHFRCILSL